MILSLVVAVSDNGVIGKDGKIPWFVRGEQAGFKAITLGHPIIMGRKTHESIGRTLPGRLNVVLSKSSKYRAQPGSIVAGSLDEALLIPDAKAAQEVFVIGGEEIFNMALPHAEKLYFTRVHTTIEDGEKFFRFDPKQWRRLSSKLYKKNQVPDRPYDFEFQEWVRK